MTKLNQILALEADAKRHAQAAVAQASGTLGNTSLLNGLSRTYQPRQEDDEQLPPESTRVQATAQDVVAAMQSELARLWDLTATKDYANCEAKADVVLDGRTLVEGAPATYLLFLEKQLAELEAFIRRLPTLDQAEKWTYDTAQGLWTTEPVQTVRTKKVPKSHVAYEATKEHPAQVQMYTEDVPAGRWTLIKYSGALPAPRVRELLDRVRALQAAVKTAREEANMHAVTDRKVGDAILGYLFA
jgi:hypothetical protein